MTVKYTPNKAEQNANKQRIRTLKAEISKKASMANKRLVRLRKNNMTSNPAYRQWVDYKGGVKFSVKGKSYNELQGELARVNNFIDSATSTVRGTNKYLKNLASNAGIKFNSVKELTDSSNAFFELASKVDDYLESANNSASAIGYQKIWSAINQYVKESDQTLTDASNDIGESVKNIVDLIGELEEEEVSDIFDDLW